MQEFFHRQAKAMDTRILDEDKGGKDSDHASVASGDVKDGDSERQEKLMERDHEIELERQSLTSMNIFKVVYLWFLLIFIHVFVFWYIPVYANEAILGEIVCDPATLTGRLGCNQFSNNPTLIIFYLIYCIYFMLQAFQISYGQPVEKKDMMKTYNGDAGLVYLLYQMIPFVYEIKTVVDWTFTKTSLDLFQWLKLKYIHGELYVTKCSQTELLNRKPGEEISRCEKCFYGFCLLVIVITLFTAPMLLFSSLSPVAIENPVVGASVSFNLNLKINGTAVGNSFNIYKNDFVVDIASMSQTEFDKLGYANVPETKFYDPPQVQIVQMNNASDTSYALSEPNKELMNYYFKKAEENKENDELFALSGQLVYSFDRNVSAFNTLTG